jgi:exosome complex protein LRP1
MEDSLHSLTTSLTNLSEQLSPLLSSQSSSSSLPPELSDLSLIDRSKLNVLTAYSIHSLLFSALRLQASSSAEPGFDIKTHPIMTELGRIKQYFEKIEEAERGRSGPRLRIDKGAAERFVRAGIKDLDQDEESGRGGKGVDMPVRMDEKKRKSEGEEEGESGKKRKSKKNKPGEFLCFAARQSSMANDTVRLLEEKVRQGAKRTERSFPSIVEQVKVLRISK